MTRPSRRKVTIGAVGVTGAVAIALALVGPNLAFAQDPTPTPSTSASAQPGGPGSPGDQAKHQDDLATALAKELGIDKSKVAAALAKIDADRPKPANPPGGTAADRTAELKTRLDAAVKAGTITQAEEDAIIKAAQAGVLLGGGPGGRPGAGGPGHNGGPAPSASPTK